MAPGSPNLLATAGADGAVHLFDRTAERITANLTRHTKKVTGGMLCLSAVELGSMQQLLHASSCANGAVPLFYCAAERITANLMRHTNKVTGEAAGSAAHCQCAGCQL